MKGKQRQIHDNLTYKVNGEKGKQLIIKNDHLNSIIPFLGNTIHIVPRKHRMFKKRDSKNNKWKRNNRKYNYDVVYLYKIYRDIYFIISFN